MITDGELRNQKNYRLLPGALSRPGRMVRLEVIDPPSPAAAATAVGTCLLDGEVSLCVTGHERGSDLCSLLTAATGACAAVPEQADFLFLIDDADLPSVRRAKRGCPESPHEGATLVFCLDTAATESPDRLRIRLTGPGIADAEGIVPELSGIAPEIFQALGQVNADYPLGVDAFFVRPDGRLMGLPRSTRIQVR